MKSVVRKYIDVFGPLDEFKYHTLIEIFGKDKVDLCINRYTNKELKEDFSYENQNKLWERFGYYYATLNNNKFIEKAITQVYNREDFKENRDNDKCLSIEDEKLYGYHLLCRDYLTICDDNNKNKLDMMKVFGSIRSVHVRDYVLNSFKYLYSVIDRTSNYDNEMKEFLDKYIELCKVQEIPNLNYHGEILEEDILIEQIDMYVRYCIAQDKFIKNNQLLIYSSCDQMNCDVNNEDLFIEGYLGLRNAVDKYDIRTGYLFSSYAGSAIRSTIFRYINRDNGLGLLALGVTELIYKVKKYCNEYLVKYGKEPDVETIAKKFNITEKKVYEIQKAMFNSECVSLDMEISSENDGKRDSYLRDFICDETQDFADKVIEHEYVNYIIGLMDSRLSETEKMILLERAKGRTLVSIAKDMNVTRERIRQMEKEGIRKIKRAPGVRV